MTRITHLAGVLIAGTAIALASTGVSAATAADVDLASGGNAPGGWSVGADTYQLIFGGANDGAPQGTLIADSGFRPYPHGFPLPNWGDASDWAQNALIYGIPERVTLEDVQTGVYSGPAPLNSLALRRTLGDGVCRDPKAIDKKTGECELILGADLLAQMIETGGDGGHCFGMAAAAAALYNGQLPANQVGASGLGINAANPMRNAAVQTITRLFGTQYLNQNISDLAGAGQSPTEMVQTLVQELPAGKVPYVLTLIGDEGGHGITPYAVTDQGDGVYDIAVYDNNFPFQAHAVTVDTKDDSFVYTSATNPNAPDYTWSTANGSTIALVPLTEILGQQPCPICRGKDQGTLVAFNAFETANADGLFIYMLDTKGEPLSEDLYTLIAPLNPDTKRQTSYPVIVVDPGVEFGVQMEAKDLKTTQPVEVYSLSNGNSEYLLLDEIPARSSFVFEVKKDATLFVSSKPSSPRMQQLYDGPRTSYDVNGHPLDLPRGVISHQKWDRTAKQVRYWSEAKSPLKWNVQVSGVDNEANAGWVALGVDVPVGAEILVDYSGATATVAPKAWVVAKGGSRTAIVMQAVTQSLIDQDRSQIYVTQGPG